MTTRVTPVQFNSFLAAPSGAFLGLAFRRATANMHQTSLSKWFGGKQPPEQQPNAACSPKATKEFNPDDPKALARKQIADESIAAIQKGSYKLSGLTHDLTAVTEHSKAKTVYYNPDSLSDWADTVIPLRSAKVSIRHLEMSSLEAARFLSSTRPNQKIGLLNFASAKREGGGFLRGTQAQEESIARSSNLYPTLMTSTGQQFYKLHKTKMNSGFYTHAMVYSPGCTCFRDDEGNWLPPMQVDVLTSPAVNAKDVRKELGAKVAPDLLEDNIEKEMRERMARILYAFEKHEATNLVLGSFGSGVFRNKVDMVARIWAELLNDRFKNSFECVVFAIIDGRTFRTFQDAYRAVK